MIMPRFHFCLGVLGELSFFRRITSTESPRAYFTRCGETEGFGGAQKIPGKANDFFFFLEERRGGEGGGPPGGAWASYKTEERRVRSPC